MRCLAVTLLLIAPAPALALRPTGLEESEPTKHAVSAALLQKRETVENMVRALNDNDRHPDFSQRREARWRPILQLGAAAVEPLTRALDDPRFAGRWSAVCLLGKLHDPRAVDPLIRALHDPQALVRQEAARTLGILGDRRAVGPLRETLDETYGMVWDGGNNARDLHIAALHAVLALDPEAVIPHLMQSLNDQRLYPYTYYTLYLRDDVLTQLDPAMLVPSLIQALWNDHEHWNWAAHAQAYAASVHRAVRKWFEREVWHKAAVTLRQLYGVPLYALPAIFTFRPAWVSEPPMPAEGRLQALAQRLSWLPPVGGKIPVLLDAQGRGTHVDGEKKRLSPTWTAEEQVAHDAALRRTGDLQHGYIRQFGVQGRLPDPFKYVVIALIMASPNTYDWHAPLFQLEASSQDANYDVAPLVHDGGAVVSTLNPLWADVPGRTDFLQRTVLFDAEDDDARFLLEAKAYQRLALALHAAQGTAPQGIPLPIRQALAGRWQAFRTAMDRLLGEFNVLDIAQVPWFIEPRMLPGIEWLGPRQEGPWEPIQRELLELEAKRRDPEYARALRQEAERILEAFTTAIDRDLGLLPESTAGLEEVPAIAVMEPWLQRHRAIETLMVEA